MKKTAGRVSEEPEMLSEYDFRGGVRGKYAKRMAAGVEFVLLAPDVAKAFPTARSVNAALRRMMKSEATDLTRRRRPKR